MLYLSVVLFSASLSGFSILTVLGLDSVLFLEINFLILVLTSATLLGKNLKHQTEWSLLVFLLLSAMIFISQAFNFLPPVA